MSKMITTSMIIPAAERPVKVFPSFLTQSFRQSSKRVVTLPRFTKLRPVLPQRSTEVHVCCTVCVCVSKCLHMGGLPGCCTTIPDRTFAHRRVALGVLSRKSSCNSCFKGYGEGQTQTDGNPITLNPLNPKEAVHAQCTTRDTYSLGPPEV